MSRELRFFLFLIGMGCIVGSFKMYSSWDWTQTTYAFFLTGANILTGLFTSYIVLGRRRAPDVPKQNG